MGRYRPPDADPQRQSFNSGRHHLGKRAHKLEADGILVVRFELPFSVWCDACSGLLIQGTRYNAEKRKVGDYYTTPVLAFGIKCRHCSAAIEVQTDPKNTQYVVSKGGKRKVMDWEPEEGDGTAVVEVGPEARMRRGLRDAVEQSQGHSGGHRAPHDAFESLQRRTLQKSAEAAREERILELEEHATQRWADPAAVNARLRDSFRQGRKQRQIKQRDEAAFRDRIGWQSDVKLILDESHQDVSSAQREWRDQRAERAQARDEEAIRKGRRVLKAGSEDNDVNQSRKKSRSSSQRSATKRQDTIDRMKPAAKNLASRMLAGKK